MSYLILIPGAIIMAMLAWSVVVLTVYLVFFAKHDSNGDVGLGFGFLAFVPWVGPYLIYRAIRRKIRRRRIPQYYDDLDTR